MPPTRTRPHPYDVCLAFVAPALGGPGGGQVVDASGNPVTPGDAGREYGLMTADGQVSRRVEPLGAGTFPESQEYASSDVYRERAFVYRRPYLGMGERTQNGSTTPRYFYAWNAQTYLTMRGRGPKWHDADTGGVAEGPVLGFVEGTHAGVVTLFILAGRYVRRHAGDLPGQQPVSLDLGAGNYARSAARWRTRGPSPVEYLYVTDSLGRIWRYNGAVWNQVTTIGTRSLLWTTRDELWGADGQFVTKCEGDPSANADWTLPVSCGDGIAPVSGMADVASRMYFFTDDGLVWAMQADTSTVCLFRGLESTRDPRNGRNPAPWLNQLYFRSGNSFYRLTGTETATFDPIGPERVQTNTSPVRGPVGAFAGVLGYYAFAGQYNPACSAPDGFVGPCSFLLRYGNWAPAEGDEEGVAQFVDAYDGAQLSWEGREITSLRYVNTPSVAGSDPATAVPRVYAGFADGGYGWITQPRSGPNPFDPNSGCFPGDVRVRAPSGASLVSRRWYEGDLIEVRTAAGHHLAGTPDHPVLTDAGWVPLDRLQVGDRVVSHGRRGDGVPAQPDEEDIPPTLREVFEAAARECQTQGVVHPLDLDHQRPGRHIDVIAADGLLGHRLDPAGGQQREHLVFPLARKRPPPLTPPRAPSMASVTHRGPAFPGSDGGGHHRPPLLRGLGRVHQTPGFARRPQLHPSVAQPRLYGVRRDPQGRRDVLERLSVGVAPRALTGIGIDPTGPADGRRPRSLVLVEDRPGQRLPGFRSTANGYPGTLERPPDAVGGAAVVPSEAVGRFPGAVAGDEVVDLCRRPFAGHVFNLTTGDHTFSANGVIVHNCEYTTGLSFLRWPRHSMDAPADLKGFLSADVTGPYLDPYRWVDVQYRVDPDGETAVWNQLARPLWQTAERVLFPAPTLGKIIEVREVYGAQAPPAAPGPAPSPYPPGPTLAEWTKLQSPVVASLILREQLRPAFRAEYALTLRATDWAPRRDGATSRLTASQIRELLVTAADAPSTVRLVLADEYAGDFTFVTYQDRMPQAGKGRRYGLSGLIDVTLVAYRTNSVRGLFSRYFDRVFSDLANTFTYLDADDL